MSFLTQKTEATREVTLVEKLQAVSYFAMLLVSVYMLILIVINYYSIILLETDKDRINLRRRTETLTTAYLVLLIILGIIAVLSIFKFEPETTAVEIPGLISYSLVLSLPIIMFIMFNKLDEIYVRGA